MFFKQTSPYNYLKKKLSLLKSYMEDNETKNIYFKVFEGYRKKNIFFILRKLLFITGPREGRKF